MLAIKYAETRQSTPGGEAVKTKEAHRAEIRQRTMARREQWQRRYKSTSGMPRTFLGLELWK